jgi:photosystem II stability/assembly factor-like uncharacterized protein
VAGPPRFFALAALADGVLLAGTCGRGATRSTDGGASWQAIPGSPDVVNAFASSDRGDVLAATGGTGVQVSADGGLTWTQPDLSDRTVFAVADAGGVRHAGTDGRGWWRSLEGTAWEQVAGLPSTATVYRLLPLGDGTVLAATDGDGVWRCDGGDAQPSGMAGASVFALADVGDGRVLAGTRGDGVHASDDGGRTWTASGRGLPDPGVHVIVASRGLVHAGTGRGVARSDDGGRTWAPAGRALANHRIFSLAATPDGGLLAGSYDGVWVLRPGAADWAPVDTGLRADDALRVCVEPGGAVRAATSVGLLSSGDHGATWSRTSLTGGPVYCVTRLATGRLLAGTNAGVKASDDGGAEWRDVDLAAQRVYCIAEAEPARVLAGTLGGGLWAGDGAGGPWQPVAAVPHPEAFDVTCTSGGDVLVATGVVESGRKTGSIFRSPDGGRTWQPTRCPPIAVYRIVERRDGTLIGGAQRSQLLRSADGGRSWAPMPDRTGLTDAKLFALTVDDRDRLYLGAGDRLLRSEDGATTWTDLDDGLDGATVFDVAGDGAGGLLAATAWGMYRSADDGLSWRPCAPPSP